ncbi:hypothetical protein [uncultured Neisseria sp.]|uniref:hypothetical protein n=1 Tax=uncultured Neisseria sp. TaxID=237778 RepID=UPI0025E761FE|nr:hypothetical protein [uncultured Neisseria sp.]
MNVLNKFGMLILTASLLAACGDSGNKGSSDKPAEQVAQSESSSANKYEKALSEFPEADPKLAEPIVISDKKSPEGLAELQKFIHFTTSEEAQNIGKMGQELQQLARQGKEAETIELLKKLTDALEKFHQSATALDIKDPEIKAVMDRTLQVSSAANNLLIYAGKYSSELTIDAKDKDSLKFAKDFQDKSQKLQETLRAANQEVEKAATALGKKYSQ